MTWNHRVVKRTYEDQGVVEFGIHETYYYDDNAEVSAITTDPVAIAGDNVPELRETLERMLAALDQPVLNWEDY